MKYLDALKKESARAQERMTALLMLAIIYQDTIEKLENIKVKSGQTVEVCANAGATFIPLQVIGDKDLLNQVWAILRASDLKPDAHVGEDVKTEFTTPWREGTGKHIVFYFRFTSNACRLVQKGTKMQEVPIYEMECDEPAPSNVVPITGVGT